MEKTDQVISTGDTGRPSASTLGRARLRSLTAPSETGVAPRTDRPTPTGRDPRPEAPALQR